jgi:hypothetical protein
MRQQTRFRLPFSVTTFADMAASLCSACGGNGVCLGCYGHGTVLVTFVADICPWCGSQNEAESGEQRVSCPNCSSQHLNYIQLVECETCTGDGSCASCRGTGRQ